MSEFHFVHRLGEVIPDLPLHASQCRDENFRSRRTRLHDARSNTCDRQEQIRNLHTRHASSLLVSDPLGTKPRWLARVARRSLVPKDACSAASFRRLESAPNNLLSNERHEVAAS